MLDVQQALWVGKVKVEKQMTKHEFRAGRMTRAATGFIGL
jgi:hypothetical protein